ncbi:BrnT family toxin [Ciceribacter sp. L1K23]|uniref:BrnT family toxin n=1 Tax=unclassified Ciceribacter TaxID=2628820 RepID=UPI001ABEA096|nr:MULTISPECIES: BrnT family toxin [unclassified Ciceribacter]MBO3761056.1 BrnT family toxin [Ciceribacter sp. L1K22]MBR0554870.1 BrnT family toxin [Ciceribacter sp. L1K23]
MEFEFDPAKSEANKAKHGIDFVAAQELWYDLFAVDADAGHLLEPRRIRIGRIFGVLWTGVYVLREERIRIISVRRARIYERRRYEDNQR